MCVSFRSLSGEMDETDAFRIKRCNEDIISLAPSTTESIFDEGELTFPPSLNPVWMNPRSGIFGQLWMGKSLAMRFTIHYVFRAIRISQVRQKKKNKSDFWDKFIQQNMEMFHLEPQIIIKELMTMIDWIYASLP